MLLLINFTLLVQGSKTMLIREFPAQLLSAYNSMDTKITASDCA